MKKINLFNLAILAGAVAILPSCKEDMYLLDDPIAEKYAQAFAQAFGSPDPGHTYSMAKAGEVTVITNTPTDVCVEAWVSGTLYTFANYEQLEGTKTIRFDVPKGVDYLSVTAGGNLHKVAVGGTLDLTGAPVRRSRTKDVTDSYQVDKSLNMNYINNPTTTETGFLSYADIEGMFYRGQGWPNDMVGWELQQYTGELKSSSADFAFAKPIKRIYDGTYNYEYIINFKRHNGHSMELGRLYGNKMELDKSTEFRLLPVYRTIANTTAITDVNHFVCGTNHKCDIKEYGYTVYIDLNAESRWINGIDIVDENATGRGKWGHQGKIYIPTTGDFDHNWFRNMLRDPQFLDDLKTASTVTLPNLEEEQEKGTTVANILDAYDERHPEDFYEQWDAYIDYWLDNTDEGRAAKPKMRELRPIKQLLGMHDIVIKENAYPQVTKESEGVYKVKFFTAKPDQTSTHINTPIDAYTGSIVINDNTIHQVFASKTQGSICFEEEKDNSNRRGSEYVYYVRDLDDPDLSHIVTTVDFKTVDGNEITAAKVFNRHVNLSIPYDGGLDMEHEMIAIDYDGDGDYSDIVFAIGDNHGGSGDPFYWILACEDLGSSFDWDYNDLVVKLQISQMGDNGQDITVEPYAAGGVYPIYLMWSDLKDNHLYIVGKEMHKWLGCNEYTMFNTDQYWNGSNSGGFTFKYDVVNHGDIRFTFADNNSEEFNKFHGGQAMNGLWVLVDIDDVIAQNEARLFTDVSEQTQLEKKLNIINQDVINELINSNKNLYRVTNNSGSQAPIARMILVGKDWKWPQENVDIRDAYPDFKNWINDRNVNWYPIEGNDNMVTKRETKPAED